jgi:hypothetical protein
MAIESDISARIIANDVLLASESTATANNRSTTDLTTAGKPAGLFLLSPGETVCSNDWHMGKAH